MKRARLTLICLTALAATAGAFGLADAVAQGRGGNRGGLLDLLRRDEVRQELGLSDEQQRRLDELQGGARSGRDLFDQYRERLRAAEGEEQQNAIRAEMEAAANKAREEAEAGVRELLTAEQKRKLVDRVIAERGSGAIGSPVVQEVLGLTPEQVTRLDDLQRQRAEAARGLFSGSDPNRFENFRKEWDEKTLAVLTGPQRERWDAALAAAQALQERPAASAPPAEETRPAPAVETARTDENAGDRSDEESEEPDENGVIASFGTGASSEPAGGKGEERLLSFNFRYAPWSEVLKLFADFSNLTLDLDDVPPGTFNYYDNRKYTATEALDVLNGYLLQKGYILVRRDNFLVCLNIDDGIPPNLVPNVTPDELPKRGQNELLNVVFPIEGVSATDVAREVELLLGPQGKVVPLGTSNSLVVTDIGSNLRRIDRLLSAVSAAGPGDLVFKSYPLRHLDPLDAESVIKTQLGLSPGVRNVSSAYEDWRRDRDRDDRDRDPRSRGSSTASAAPTAQVSADERTGSLLVTATAAQHRIVEEVLKVTDVPVSGDGRSRLSDNEPYLEVYRLNRSDPQEVVKTLDVLMPGVVVNEDGRARKIHVHAPRAVQNEVAALIRQLDGEGTAGGAAVTVIPLSTLDPYGAAATIRSLFASEEEDAPVVEADSFGRRLMVRGTADQVAQIKTLLAELGEDGTGRAGGNGSSGPVRTIPLGGRDPEEMIPLLQRIWESTGDSPLRVVPTGPGTIIERRPLGRSEPAARSGSRPVTLEERDADPAPAANFNILDPVPATAAEPEEAGVGEATPNAGETAPEEAAPDDGAAADGSPEGRKENGEAAVAVTVQGGNLVLASEDEEALNRLEDLVQRLGQVVPPRTKWTVFYLRSADATETAMLLEQLFPSSSVSTASLNGGLFGSLTSGLSDFGGNVMSAAGLDSFGLDTQTLRIIPDIRSNSLFVTGPPDKVAEVEQVLNVLDATDLPDSLRDRVPRMIEVRYAEVEQVAEIVREVYKDYLQPANMAAAGGNPLAMLLAAGGGGGGRGDRDRRDQAPGAIRMTVGVDSQTSRLIVSADDALFRQVEELVRSLDESAYQAKRTVRVVALENADAAMVQTSIASLIPKVRTSSTADRRSGTNGQPSASNGGGSTDRNEGGDRGNGGQSQEDQERIRRFFEERMRERMQQGGGNGDRGGFRPPFGFGGGDRDRDSSRSFGRGR
ncbi:MAG TPA: secretin N-terminal domain-containing protein [Planctomycetaceae bacterium]